MKQMEPIMNVNAALAHSMTFKELDPYEVDTLCETLFAQFEQFFIDGRSSRKHGTPFNLAEYKHLHILGMRKFHLLQLYAQKVSYDNFCEEQRLLANMPVQLTEEEKAEHREKLKHVFDELKQDAKKGPDASKTHGRKAPTARKKAA